MTDRDRILLLEDDPNLGVVLQEHLELNGFQVVLCVNGVDGMAAYTQRRFDLCLVDIMMPRKDGFTFAREVRQRDQETPIIFLTAKSLREDRIEGFRVGGDDYLTKPFSMEELLLRIHAVLKRTKGRPTDEIPAEFEIGNYVFNHNRQILALGDRKQRLTPRESDLLCLLCIHMNRTLERGTALKEIWNDESYFSGRSMDVFISKLRKYLKDDPRVEIISVHGKGFKLVVN